ncbi:Uncharacterized protein BP5553_04209 [Venustampulla echinocandica]|uniref:AAA+ ATPase domain-containing protein n=1 Tax=Venustampulla echinocandica TaxID=2656787 RepID=A0A370TWH1_9HELO|nr:Uncharacterized protein BP5553_04209 [Venustampulla echinocandica]RDL39869.1 Uncharacterized protein BP5553_04209 [Venustampulla echinocandica]
MDTPSTNQSDLVTEREGGTAVAEGSSGTPVDNKARNSPAEVKKAKIKKMKHCKKGKKAKAKKSKEVVTSESEDSNSSSDSDTASDESLSDSEEDSESESETETEKEKRKRKAKKKAKQKAKDKRKTKLKKKVKKEVSSDSDSDTEPESDVDSETQSEVDEEPEVDSDDNLQQQILDVQQQIQQLQTSWNLQSSLGGAAAQTALGGALRRHHQSRIAAARYKQKKLRGAAKLSGIDGEGRKKNKKEKKVKQKRGSKLEFKRVDQLWDSTIHNYKLTDTAEDAESSEYDQYLFNVRRTFDWEGKYKNTVVDIKSKLIKEALNEVMDGVKGVSLVEETPTVDPNLLFLYLEDLRASYKALKNKKVTVKKGKKKAKKHNATKRAHLKVLVKYLDRDYASTKKTLYPMLESGLITFDLLWALYKPNTLAYTTTYGSVDEPRAFRIELAEKESHFMKGEWYNIEGKYLEYDGKTWGMGTMDVDVPAFKGARKITSLGCYPLKYHKDETKLRAELIERGKKFVSLQGVNYRAHEGLAYYKKKKQIIKVNINGRIMVDPAIHRRINPNYNVSTVKPQDPDLYDSGSDSDDDSDDGCGCCDESDDDQQNFFEAGTRNDDDEPRTKMKVVLDNDNQPRIVRVPIDADGQEVAVEKLEEVPSNMAKNKDGEAVAAEEDKKAVPVLTDEEYLIASPVVLGFAFAEKLWLEFTVSGVKDIVWNEGAYESLVLEGNTKAIVKALVESHKYHPAESIDDVIQGKGKGLVAVLHGPPGTGKTLTAEGISELLKCPLYMVSAGELGTDPRTLEAELQKILDIAHAWGAVLLLDEADVFLEKRTIQDIHRNALVSIFLRLLEYFQGILFLTTNRVETFDDAFQSRIHIALRYGELSTKAKRSVFKMFIERVRVLEGVATMPFTEEDLNSLSRHNLNGRQIKNTIRTAQALAVNVSEPLSMEHIKRVLDVSNAFDRDLKGGPGFEDAMRGYF